MHDLCTSGSSGLKISCPRAMSAQFAVELTSLRECVQELRRERGDLRAELAAAGPEVNRPNKTRTLATPSLDLMITDQVLQTLVQHSAPRSSDLVESAIERADAGQGECVAVGTLRSLGCRVEKVRSTLWSVRSSGG